MTSKNQLSVVRALGQEERSIYHSLKFCVILGQFFGILPQENITSSADKLCFKWKSIRVLYTFLIMLLLVFSTAMCFIHSLAGFFSFDHLVTTTFFAVGLVTLILYLHLARNFSKLISDWCETDKIMNHDYGYPENLDFRLKVITAVAITLVIGDYIFGITFHVLCSVNKFDADFDSNLYFKNTFPTIFYQTSTHRMLGGFASVTIWLCTFIWTYNDLFIILISTTLALRFKQITECLMMNERKPNSNEFWIIIRKNYDLLSVLCKNLDSNISFIVLLSFASNIFFVLVQLFYSFRTIDDTLGKVYFFYSFSHLILRLVAVSLYAAWINDESKEPANILNSLPSGTYNMEIRRLLLQISFDNVALTGSKMFKVTRGLILSVASAVVTYELVLIQFNTAASSP